jgi:CsoR family transcriptional regulator, copper-sensing transcriptional repressor
MIDDETKKKAIRRLKIIEGQVKGIQRMVDNEDYCVDVLTQISAVHESLRGVGKVIVRRHLESCVTSSIRGDNPDSTYDELMDIMYKLSR